MIRNFLYIGGAIFLLISMAEWMTAWFQPKPEETESVNIASIASAMIGLTFFLLALLRKFGV